MNNYRRNSKPHSRLLPYATIRAASEGDPDAVNAVLRHYEGYITRLAMRQLHDEYGNITSVAKDRKAPSGGKSRTREADDAAIFA